MLFLSFEIKYSMLILSSDAVSILKNLKINVSICHMVAISSQHNKPLVYNSNDTKK
jgi:hypothetical protein